MCRLVKRLSSRTPTSVPIRELGWLRAKDRITIKVCCFVHKCVYGYSPPYLSEMLSHPSCNSSVTLRSYESCRLFVPISHFSSVRGAFSFHAPRCWNELPATLRQEHRLNVFKRKLRAHILLT